VDTFKGKVFNQIKSFFLSFFCILSRHFNSINLDLQGKVDSYRSNLDRYINENKERIDKTRKTIEKLSKKEIESNQRKKHLNKIHQKKRRLARLEKRLEQLESDKVTGRTRICFGSRKLFNAQFDLKANDYENLEQWKSDYLAPLVTAFGKKHVAISLFWLVQKMKRLETNFVLQNAFMMVL